VELKDPGKVIGTNTVTHIQAGLYYGAVDMVDGMLTRMKSELAQKQVATDLPVVATGGQAKLVARGSKHIKFTDEFLTLKGLRLIWEKNPELVRDLSADDGKTAAPVGGGKRDPKKAAR
jgi:type III pantothenate kinase